MNLAIALLGILSITFHGKYVVFADDEVEQWSVDKYSRNLRTKREKNILPSILCLTLSSWLRKIAV